MKNQAFKHLYALTNVITRRKKKYVASGSNLRKIQTIMVCHKFDTTCLFVTLPTIYESSNDKITEAQPIVNDVLTKVQEKIDELSKHQNPVADCTNRHSWGKIKIQISRIVNFPY